MERSRLLMVIQSWCSYSSDLVEVERQRLLMLIKSFKRGS